MIGTDLSSNGGIASVVKAFYSAHKSGRYTYDIRLIKTNHYKDKGFLHEILIFIISFIKCIYFSFVGNFGIFHIHSSAKFSFYRKAFFVLLGRVLRKKIIFHIHSSDFYNFFLSDNKFVGIVLGLTDCVIVLCDDWYVKLSKKYPDINILKIENPHNILLNQYILNKKTSRKFKVVFVGFLIESKGIRDLVLLAKKLKDSGRDDILIQIAGKGELSDFIIKSINEHELHDYLEFLGWVSGNLKDHLYSNADVFILPSYKEGMPISILEAMAWGLPVVSTCIAGTPDIVKNGVNGFLLTPGDVAGFYSSITLLAMDVNLRRIIHTNNIDRAAKNSKEKIFYQVDELYNSLRCGLKK
jgi:glycosyltransferase involved in cell wall biosynthesis